MSEPKGPPERPGDVLLEIKLRHEEILNEIERLLQNREANAGRIAVLEKEIESLA